MAHRPVPSSSGTSSCRREGSTLGRRQTASGAQEVRKCPLAPCGSARAPGRCIGSSRALMPRSLQRTDAPKRCARGWERRCALGGAVYRPRRSRERASLRCIHTAGCTVHRALSSAPNSLSAPTLPTPPPPWARACAAPLRALGRGVCVVCVGVCVVCGGGGRWCHHRVRSSARDLTGECVCVCERERQSA